MPPKGPSHSRRVSGNASCGILGLTSMRHSGLYLSLCTQIVFWEEWTPLCRWHPLDISHPAATWVVCRKWGKPIAKRCQKKRWRHTTEDQGDGKTLGSKKARRHAHFKPSQRLLWWRFTEKLYHDFQGACNGFLLSAQFDGKFYGLTL